MASLLVYDPQSYPAQIQARLAELQDFFHTNLTKPACSQKLNYDQHTKQPTFVVSTPVRLSISTARKFDPRWEGEWVIKAMKSPTTAEICDGKHTRIVYTNRLHHCYVPDTVKLGNANDGQESTDWTLPSVDHIVLPLAEQTMTTRYPQRNRKPPEWYRS